MYRFRTTYNKIFITTNNNKKNPIKINHNVSHNQIGIKYSFFDFFLLPFNNNAFPLRIANPTNCGNTKQIKKIKKKN
jgi:hypothetical protein